MLKEIQIATSIFDLSDELKGFDYVRFVDWDPDNELAYSVGSGKMESIFRGMELRISQNLFLYKTQKRRMHLAMQLR